MHTINFLINLVIHHQILAYIIIYLGLIFEGEFVLISTGILVHLGALNLWISLLFIFLGSLSKTFIGYALGELLYKKFNHHGIFKYIRKRVHSVLPRFKTKPFWSIFASKFIIYANNVTIIFCGYEKIDYRKFLKAEILATVIWAPMLLALGYFFSYTALHVSHGIWKFSLVVLILSVIFILFDKLLGWMYELFEAFYDRDDD